MPHISKKRLDQKVFLAMYERFQTALTSLRNKKESGKLIRELLTPTERIMIAKRIAIVYMLHTGHSIYEVEQTLKVSPSTAARYSLKSDSSDFTFLVSLIKKNEGLGKIFDTLEQLLTHRARGKGRWDFLNKL